MNPTTPAVINKPKILGSGTTVATPLASVKNEQKNKAIQSFTWQLQFLHFISYCLIRVDDNSIIAHFKLK